MDELSIAIIDDHVLFRRGLIKLINHLDGNFKVIQEADNGKDFIEQLENGAEPPLIAILDLNMPVMDGYETAAILQRKYPNISVLILTMDDDDISLIKMLKLGVKGYLGKEVEPVELNKAILSINKKGYHYTDKLTGQLIQSLLNPSTTETEIAQLKEREFEFIQLACSEDTYEKIADIMCLSPKTVDSYRASVFQKLQVRSRVGLVMYAIKNGLVIP